jgi:hypothetical protein
MIGAATQFPSIQAVKLEGKSARATGRTRFQQDVLWIDLAIRDDTGVPYIAL